MRQSVDTKQTTFRYWTITLSSSDWIKKKRKKLEGLDEGGTRYLSQSEVDEKIQSVKAETESEYRNQLIRELYETGKLTQTEIADAVGLTQSTVNKILTNR